MRFELVFLRRLTSQIEQVRPVFRTKCQETGGPGVEDGGSHSVARSMNGTPQDCAADSCSDGIAWNFINGQGSGLRHEVPRRRVEFSCFEERFKNCFIHRQPHEMAKRARCQLQQMCRMTQ